MWRAAGRPGALLTLLLLLLLPPLLLLLCAAVAQQGQSPSRAQRGDRLTRDSMPRSLRAINATCPLGSTSCVPVHVVASEYPCAPRLLGAVAPRCRA